MAEWNELDLGGVDAYAAAVKAGYTGTRQQWMTAMQDAEANGLKAEGYANGKQNGTAVESGTYFHDNAQYYKEQAEAAKTAAQAAQAAAESAAETDLVAWLAENITNPDSPPLDRTLASSSSAAPADMVGDLKSAFTRVNREIWIFRDLVAEATITQGQYYGNKFLNITQNSGFETVSGIQLKANTKYTSAPFIRNATYGAFTWFRLTNDTYSALTYTNDHGYTTNDDGSVVFETGSEAPTIYISYKSGVLARQSEYLWLTEGEAGERPAVFPQQDVTVIPNQYDKVFSKAKYIKYFKNILDYTVWENGHYWFTANNAIAVQNGDFAAYYPTPIILKPNTTYTIKDFVLNATYGTFSLATYNGTTVTFLNYLARVGYTVLHDNSITFTTEQTDSTIIRLSHSKADSYYDIFVVEGSGEVAEGMTRNDEVCQLDNFDDPNIAKIHNLYVDATYTSSTIGYGVSRFSSVVSAINSIGVHSNERNIYNIYIYSGEYDLYEEYGGSTWLDSVDVSDGERQGPTLPDYVNLIGIGMPHLYGEIADANATEATSKCCSPLHCWKHNKLINLKITARNARYCVHCESNNSFRDTDIEVINCYMEHYGNILAQTSEVVGGGIAWGCGTGSAAKIKLKNSQFVSSQAQGVYIHNNSNQSANYVEIDGCYLKAPAYTTGLNLQSVGSGSEVGKCYIKNTIGDPSIYSGQATSAWDVYDFANNRIVPHSP